MTDRHLGSLQVAAMLVSASYGVGFLFGSGELAMTHGMAGALYGVATAMGMLLLAALAGRLWTTGLPLWTMFGRAYGPRVQESVALLSLLWMAGVLAAQIQGAHAVLQLLGLDDRRGHWLGFVLALGLILVVSRIELRLASIVFALCLLASAVVLVYALVLSGGLELYERSLPEFFRDLSTYSPARVVATTIAVSLLVATGADYHQFALAARRPGAAVAGCVLAALVLVLMAFLPAAVVVAARNAGALGDLEHARHVIPLVLSHVASNVGPGADACILVALSAGALGSGGAVLRAMTEAVASATPSAAGTSRLAQGLLALGLGAVLAAGGRGIVDTMVSVNVIYLASVTVCLVALLCGRVLLPRQAIVIMSTGFSVSLAVQAFGPAVLRSADADILALASGLGASVVAGGLVFLFGTLRGR